MQQFFKLDWFFKISERVYTKIGLGMPGHIKTCSREWLQKRRGKISCFLIIKNNVTNLKLFNWTNLNLNWERMHRKYFVLHAAWNSNVSLFISQAWKEAFTFQLYRHIPIPKFIAHADSICIILYIGIFVPKQHFISWCHAFLISPTLQTTPENV